MINALKKNHILNKKSQLFLENCFFNFKEGPSI